MTETLKKENSRINVYLGELKKPWMDYCESISKKPGAALKEAIEHQLKKNAQPSLNSSFQQVESNQTTEAKIRFEVLLTESEKAALEARAELENCSQRRWVIDAIRAGLTKEPQFGMQEIEALGESNYQLLAIGRNLNQLVKRLTNDSGNAVDAETIIELNASIKSHVSTVSAAIRASLERWSIQ